MSNIKLDIPDITVVIEKGSEYLSTVTPSEVYQVLVNTGDNYNVVVDEPATITVNGSGSYLTVADYASTASYALFAQSLVAGGAVAYDTISASNAYFGNLTVSQSIRANLFTGSFRGDGSQLTGVGVSGGTNKYLPLWTGTSTLSSSLLFQTGSSILLGSTTQHTPEAPDRFGVFAGVTDSYNLISGHGETDQYLQLNVKNFSGGQTASSDVVATADTGNEFGGFIDFGINSSNYALVDGIGGPLDAYLYSTGSDLLIGNASPNKRIILFTGGGNAVNNARVYIDASGSVGINTSQPTIDNPEALVVDALTNSYNLITARGNVDTYSQINIKNLSGGNSASADIVATANNGNETTNFIDMGINSDQYNQPNFVGGPNDAYLYSTGNILHIGNATPNNDVMFFAGGEDSNANNKLILSANNQHSLSGSLNVTGSINVLSGVINNLTASFAISSSFAPTKAGVVSSSAQVSYTGLSNIPANIVSGSTQIVALGFATTGSNSFNGNQTITGSLIHGLEGNIATGENSHAEGSITKAIGNYSHAEGDNTQAIGDYSHAEGQETIASGSYSHAEGYQTIALANHQHVQGQYNAVSSVPAAFIVGNGTDDSNRSNLIYAAGNEVQITGSLKVTTGITGSLFGTSSQAITASYVLPTGLPTGTVSSSTQASMWTVATASIATSASFSTTASAATSITFTPLTASFATTASAATSITFIPQSSSFATTASYVLSSGLPSGVVSSSSQVSYTGLSNVPSGIVSSSSQINTGSFSGSFTGQFIGTSSNAVSASYAPTILPTGIVSSSSQIQLNQITGTTFSASNFTFPQNLTVAGTLVAQEFLTKYVSSSVIYESGSTKFGDTLDDTHQFTGSVLISGSSIVLGSFTASAISSRFTGSLFGTSSVAITASAANSITFIPATASFAPTASFIEYSNVSNKPTLVSSSTQINTGSFSGSFTGQFIGTSSWATNAISSSYAPTILPSGTVSSSTQVDYTQIQNKPTVIATASYVEYNNVANKPTLISSSTQVNYNSIQNQPTTIPTASFVLNAVSASFALTASYVSGAASDWNSVANKPSGLVSSSIQINTGSFSGSFTGVLIGTSSWASNAISSSFATTASAATSITFTPSTASFATTASYAVSALSASWAPSLATGSTAWTSLTGIPVGLVSSSAQINTGSFSGSFVGTLTGTSSWASNAISSSYVLPSGLPAGTISSSTQVSYIGLSNIPANIVSSSAQVAAFLPTGTVSSSVQINTGSFTGSFIGSLTGTGSWARSASVAISASFAPTILPSGVVSSSSQVSYTGLSNIPSGVVSSSSQVTAFLPTGTVSSSTQINTGSFSGSFTGTLAGTSSWASNAISSSFATSASWAPSAAGVVSSYTNATDNRVITSTGAGGINAEANLTFDGTILSISTNNAKFLQGGDDVALHDINVSNTLGVYGVQDTTVGAIKLGSSGQTIYSNATGVGIGTITPSTLLHVQGTVSASSVTASGDIVAGTNLVSNFSANDEGGEIRLARPQTNTSISGSVKIDVYQNKLRIFEGDSPNRGGYWDITSLAGGVGTNLAGGAGTVTSVTAGSGLTGGTITGAGTITLDTGSAHFTGGVAKVIVTSASFATTASFATSASFAPTILPSGVVSSSGQVSYTGLSNVPVGIVSSSAQVTSLLPAGTVSSSGQVSYTGLSNIPANIVSSSAQVTELLPANTVSSSAQINTGSFTGSFTGTFVGTSSFATTASVAISASFAPTILPSGVVSSSGQVSYTGLSNIPSGIVSSSNQFNALTNTSASYATRTPLGTSYDSRSITFVGNSRITEDGNGNIDIIAGSPASYAEIGSFNNENFVYVDNFGTYIQTNYTTNPTRLWTFGMDGTLTTPGLIIGTASWASNVVSSSFATTASYALNATATLPSGLISSSTQFISLTAPFTGSFTGSFIGTHSGSTFGTASWANNTVSSSFATTAATASSFTGYINFPSGLDVTGSLYVTGSATVVGAFQATTKSFKIDHQILLGKKLIYGVLEGPEHGVYVRGRLTKNTVIQLPEEWKWLVDPISITVQLTPIGTQQILYVQNIENNTVIINSSTPIDCFYFVQATRKDVAPLATVE